MFIACVMSLNILAKFSEKKKKIQETVGKHEKTIEIVNNDNNNINNTYTEH